MLIRLVDKSLKKKRQRTGAVQKLPPDSAACEAAKRLGLRQSLPLLTSAGMVNKADKHGLNKAKQG